MSESAGQKLRARLDAALEERGAGWEWTPYDQEVIDSAARHADRAAQLQAVYDAELAGDQRPTTLARLSAIDTKSVVCLSQSAMVTAPEELPSSARHQAAVNTRWRRKREREAARVVPMRGA